MNAWVRVADRLPPMYIRVLACFEDGLISVAERMDGWWDYEIEGSEIPTHWMHLPDLPEEVTA